MAGEQEKQLKPLLEYRKGDMLKNMNQEDIFLHACNTKGVWGNGIARQFRIKHPTAYEAHKNMPNRLGTGYVLEDRGFKIACIMTSKGFGAYVDTPREIVMNTYNALIDMFSKIKEKELTIHSPKINSGLFKTPWQKTKKALVKACEDSGKNIKWIVWEL